MPKITATYLRAGLRGSTEMTVAEHHAAPHIGSGHVKVLATPVLLPLMEAAALESVDGRLPEGYQSVGTRTDVRHFAATPVGMRVTVSAELIKVDVRSIMFRLTAEDEQERIGQGSYERIIINVARFDQRIREKLFIRVAKGPRKQEARL